MKKVSLLLPLLLLPLIALQAGGPWPQARGKGYFKLSQWWIIADRHFTDAGLTDPNVTNGVFTTSIYGEYGLTDRLTAIAYVPFFSRAYFNNTVSGTTGEVLIPGEAINGLGDTDISLSYGLITGGPVVLSARIMLGLPTGIASGGSQGNLQTGDGEFNQMLQVDAGTSFRLGNASGWASGYIGYNNRTNGFSDELRAGLEAGITFLDQRFYALIRLFTVQSMFNGNREDTSGGQSLFANNAEHFSYSPEIAWNINDTWGVAASFAGAFSGRLIYANPTYSFGLYMRL